jgi:site-specific recombinase XerC
MQSVYCGDGLTKRQNQSRDLTIERDAAIITVFLHTGIRVSELVGLNVGDLDFQEHCFKVIRKRDKIDTIYFDDEVTEVLKDYLRVRPLLHPADNEDALFLVSIGKYKGERLSVRSMQMLVKKYAMAGAPSSGALITPHKLRSTYATNMLKATGNLDLVRAELGHSDPKTTLIYARSDNADKKAARNVLISGKYGEVKNHEENNEDNQR